MPEALEDAHVGALKEAASNLLGAWATGLGEIVSGEIKPAGDAEVLEGDCGAAIAAAEGIAGDDVFIWRYSLTVGEIEGEYILAIPGKPLMELIKAHPDYVEPAEGEEAAEPAEEAAPEEAEPLGEKKEVAVEKAVFQPFEEGAEIGESAQIGLLLDVPLTVSVELGRKRLSIKEILDMIPGSLLELDKLAGEPVDLMVNGKLFAHGEVVVIDENFGVRISSIVSPKERLDRLK
jgi:flagellar motor switch protein FliN/FliY